MKVFNEVTIALTAPNNHFLYVHVICCNCVSLCACDVL
jgi:hypothetical protein